MNIKKIFEKKNIYILFLILLTIILSLVTFFILNKNYLFKKPAQVKGIETSEKPTSFIHDFAKPTEKPSHNITPTIISLTLTPTPKINDTNSNTNPAPTPNVSNSNSPTPTNTQAALPSIPILTLSSSSLNFGTTIYPFRASADVPWLLDEAHKLGLTELRVEYPRNYVERTSNDVTYNPTHYVEIYSERMDLLRKSGFDFIFVLDGTRANEDGHVIDWPRDNNDYTIDGQAAGPGMANFAAWTVRNTKDFVKTYELWNEAFSAGFDPFSSPLTGKKIGFGAGGSKKNADNYAEMMLPVVNTIREINPTLQITIEGNYWNLDTSVGKSEKFQQLLEKTDYVVYHPYNYNPDAYLKNSIVDNNGNLLDGMLYTLPNYYKKFNPKIKFWFTEYGLTKKSLTHNDEYFSDKAQAKAVLRTTLLHLLNSKITNLEHLDIFDLYYTSTSDYTLIKDLDGNHVERPAFFALQRLIKAISPKTASSDSTLIRKSELPGDIKELAIAKQKGFTYIVYKDTFNKTATPPINFEETIQPENKIILLSSSNPNKILKLDKVIDPLTGDIVNANPKQIGNNLEITLPITDSPLICEFVE